jgi:ferredoxin-NADP reductase
VYENRSEFNQWIEELSRTGWFYRILKEGTMQTGDEMTLCERPNPEWTVARVQYYLYHDMRNEEAMKELVQIKELGAEIHNIFANRLKKQYENQLARMRGGDEMALNTWSDYDLIKRTPETPKIVSLIFSAKDPVQEPELVQPGSYVRLRLGRKLVRAYSVVAGDTNQFELAVAHSASSRGGSRFIHTRLRPGDTLSVGKITSSFPLAVDAEKHVFISGGIGLTAFIASAQRCQKDGSQYHIHHLVRTSKDIALRRYLDEFGSNVTIYDKSRGKVFDVEHALKGVGFGTHIYCCGSDRLMNAVAESARCLGIGQDRQHFEKFEISTSGDPFTAQLSESKTPIEVKWEQTLLGALREAGLDITSSCEAGNCGTCRVGVKEGRIEHRGTGLQEKEKCSSMLSCVSRGVGKILLEL